MKPLQMMRRFPRFLAVGMCLILAGCYLPVRYDAEIDISRTGYYEFFFDGYIAKVQLYQDIVDGKIDRQEEQKQVEIIRNDFQRDSATQAFEYFTKGHFRVNYERSGDLLRSKSFTFFRRNEYMLGFSYNDETGQISMLGKSLSRDVKDRIRAAGLDSSGELRLFTDGRVVSHNANTVRPFPSKGPGYQLYTWKFANILAPTPALKIQVR